MHLSLNWLQDFVDLAGLAPGEIAHELTMRTALIEGLVDQRTALEGVVVGRVLSAEPHPDADRLSVCSVDTGAGTAHVVCGAPNVATGQHIVYAPVGTRLPNGLKLKQAKIRGVASEGMICAEDELGLGPEHDGILVLDPRWEPGRPVGEVTGLCDVVLEIDNKSVTHRPDLWGHYGFARELAAITGRELAPLELAGGLVAQDTGPAITLEADSGCPLYAGLCVEGSPGPSPDWLRFRLVACGMRPLQRLVDVSNYVMLEIGQPTHPFDRDRLRGDRIVVRRARPGEVLETLDGERRSLAEGDTVIADGERAVALAGIMGGADTEVTGETRRLFLESASFEAQGVRRTSSRLGLRSEALARFEKTLDPALVEQAVRRYAHLLGRIDPEARVAAGFRVAGRARAPTVGVTLSAELVRARLGIPVEDGRIVALLERLGFAPAPAGDGCWEVAVPSWRATRDVTIPEDLVEEVGRMVGYDAVPTRPPVGPLRVAARDPLLGLEEGLRDALARRAAFTESLAYSTLRDSTSRVVGLPDDVRRPRLANALQKDAATLRPSVVPEMLARLEAWLRHEPEVRCFEIGRGYALDGEDQVLESRELAALIGVRERRDARELVRAVRGVADVALEAIDRERPVLRRMEPGPEQPWLHPARSAELLCGGSPVGRMGAVAPEVLARLGLEGAAAVLVLDLRALDRCPARGSTYAPVSRQPPARIDLAFVAPYGLTTDAIASAMRDAGPRTLRSVEPFDVYRGEPLAGDERSVAFHLVFQARDRTLTDVDVNKARERIVAAVEKLGARLR